MSKFVKVLVIGFMTLSTILWSAGSALAVSVAADYTKTDVATDTFGRAEINQLVLNILLNNDVLIHNGATASVAGDPLIAFPADTKFIDSDNTGVYSDGKAILVSADGNLTAGVLSGAGTDDVITDGTADIAAFAATHFVYDDNASDNNDYDNGEAIIIDNDADGMPTAGDTVVTAGLAGVIAFDVGANDKVYLDDVNSDGDYTAGEAIWFDVGDTGVFLAATDWVLVGTAAPLATGLTTRLNLLVGEGGLAYLDDNGDGFYTTTKDTSAETIVWFGAAGNPTDGDALALTTTFFDPAQLAGDDINGTWLEDMTALSTIIDVGYVDADHNNAYTNGEAIVQEAGAAAIDANLETTDTVLTTGLADITVFPATDIFNDDNAGATYTDGEDIYRETDNTGDGDNVIDKLQLNAITVQNAGTAVFNDIAAVHVWLDADGNGILSATLDTDLGAMTADANGWTLSGLTTNISAAVARLFVAVDVYSGADDNRTIQMRIPVRVDGNANGQFDAGDEGIFVDGANTVGDGPSDTVILNANTQTIDVPSTPGGGSDTTAPAVPTGITAQGTGVAGEIKLMWTNPTTSDFAGVRIFRSSSSGTAALSGAIVVVSTTATTYTDTGLTDGSTYYYALKSMDNNGNAATASEVSAVAGSQPSITITATSTEVITTTATTTTLAPVTLPYASPTTTEQMQANLTALLAQLTSLQNQLAAVQGEAPPLAASYAFNTNFGQGIRSDTVKNLQTILIHEELLGSQYATGYFGVLTLAAVKKFQAKYNISPQSGYVGPLTRAQLNKLYGGGQ